jgi:sporulation integral membrane protein YtvI
MTEERKAAERLAFKFLCLLFVIAVVVWIVPMAWRLLSPFIVAIPLAALLQPIIAFMQKKLKFRRGFASLLIVLVLTAIVLAILIWLFTFGIGQVSNIVSNSGDIVTDSISSINTALNNLLKGIGNSAGPGVEKWLRNAVNNMVNGLGEWASDAANGLVALSVQLATSMPYVIIYISFLVMGLYFIANNYDEIRSHLPAGSRRNQNSNTTKLTKSAIRSLTGYLRVQCTFGLMVWIISWIVLSIFHFRYSAITALFMGIMELIPMIGSGLPYFVMSALQFLLGNPTAGFQLLGLTLGLQVLRRILEPKLMSDSIGITPLQSLIGMFVGMRIGGILGLIGGPVMMSVLVGAFRANLQGSTIKDARCIINYFKKRWA